MLRQPVLVPTRSLTARAHSSTPLCALKEVPALLLLFCAPATHALVCAQCHAMRAPTHTLPHIQLVQISCSCIINSAVHPVTHAAAALPHTCLVHTPPHHVGFRLISVSGRRRQTREEEGESRAPVVSVPPSLPSPACQHASFLAHRAARHTADTGGRNGRPYSSSTILWILPMCGVHTMPSPIHGATITDRPFYPVDIIPRPAPSML